MKKFSFWLYFVLLIALAIRIAYLFLLKPPFGYVDAAGYDMAGWNLSLGNGYTTQTNGELFMSREPGYALFLLAPVYWLFGHSWLAVQLGQVVISVLAVFLIYYLAKKYLTEKVALTAAFLYAIFPSAIVYSGELLTETFFTFLLLIFFVFLLKGADEKSKAIVFFSGLLLGMATLTRFITFFFFLATIPILYFYCKNYFSGKLAWRQAVFSSILILLGVLLIVAPWIIKVSLESGTFIFGRLGGSVIYWTGSLVKTDGEWIENDQQLAAIAREENDSVKLEKKLAALTVENIINDPVGVAMVWLKKPFKIFLRISDFRIPTGLNKDGGFIQCFENSQFLKECFILGMVNLVYWFLFGVALLGWRNLLKSDKRPMALVFLTIFLYFFIFYMPMSPSVRYREPLLPYLVILSAVWLVQWEKTWLAVIGFLAKKVEVFYK